MSRFPVTRKELKMKMIRFMVCVTGLLLAATSVAYGGDIYFAQPAAGSANGTSCANAYAASGINTSSYWAPGNNIHLCGAIAGAAGSTLITPPASGSSGSPITIMFESGASLSSPYWSANGAIYISGQSYITVDGNNSNTPCGYVNGSEVACNGSISNTVSGAGDNGTGLTHSTSSSGIVVNSSSYIEIRNLKIYDIYLNAGSSSSASDTNGASTYGVYIEGGPTYSNILVHNCEIADASVLIDQSINTTSASGLNFYNNYLHDSHWHIAMGGTSGNPTISANIYGNEITDWTNWQYPTGTYHTDGMILMGVGNSSSPNAIYNIYGNYIHGDLGYGSATGFIFCTYGLGSQSTYASECNIYNNLLVASSSETAGHDLIWLREGSGGPHHVYNNTIVGAGSGKGDWGIYAAAASGHIIKNNIFYNIQSPIVNEESLAAAPITSNYNVFYGCGTTIAGLNDGGLNYSFAQWQSEGQDVNSSTSTPNLNSSYRIASASGAAYQTGSNLTSLGSTAVIADMAGGIRPATGAWDIGAYEFSTAVIPAPAGVHLVP